MSAGRHAHAHRTSRDTSLYNDIAVRFFMHSSQMARDGAKNHPAAPCVACNGMQRTKLAAAAREAVGKLRRRSVAPSRWRLRPHLAAKLGPKAHTTRARHVALT
ncbi:hypothetical protein GCM10028796_12260 [Ramlibacter monticola]